MFVDTKVTIVNSAEYSKAGCDTYVTDDPPWLLRTLRPRRSIAGEFEDEAEGERTPWNFEAGNCDVTRASGADAVKTAANENTRLY